MGIRAFLLAFAVLFGAQAVALPAHDIAHWAQHENEASVPGIDVKGCDLCQAYRSASSDELFYPEVSARLVPLESRFLETRDPHVQLFRDSKWVRGPPA